MPCRFQTAEGVRDKRSGVDPARFNQLEYLGAVTAVDSAGLERQIFTIHIGQRQKLRLVVQRDYRDCRVRPRAFPRESNVSSPPATSNTASAPEWSL